MTNDATDSPFLYQLSNDLEDACRFIRAEDGEDSAKRK